MLVLGALALSIPAASLAAGGGSAGDQQYTDPFANTTTARSTATAPAGTSTAIPAPAPATATAPASTPAPDTTPGATATADPATATADPTAATASPSTLAFTGFDSRLAGALGATMIAGGLILRRRARRA